MSDRTLPARPLSGFRLFGPATEVRMTVQQPATDTAGVAQLFLSHSTAMVRLAVLLVDDLHTAEDVVQDAYGKLYAGWDRLRDPDAAVGYLRTAVVNGCRSVLRRRRTARLFIPPRQVDVPAADTGMLLAEEHRGVLAALKRLPRRQREVLVLRFWSELSEAQIADALGISRGTVKSSASRGLTALSALLDTTEG